MTVLAQEPVPDDLLPFGWVDCGVIDVVGDDTSDDDQDPGSVPVVGDGLIVFIPKVTEMRVMRNGRSTLVRNRPVPANLDQDGVIELAGHRLVKLWHGIWSCVPGNRSVLDFDAFDFELTGDYTASSPLPLWHIAPYVPPDGVTVTTMEVPSGQQPGQSLAWDGSQLAWVTPKITPSVSTLAAGSNATASMSGSWPNLTLGLGIPAGQPSASQIIGAGRPDVAASMTTAVQAQVSAAPVGSTFSSTDGASVGAWKWEKLPSGWTVTYGDTGTISASAAALINGWTGSVKVSRIVNDVEFAIFGLRGTAAIDDYFLNIPSGFRPIIGYSSYVMNNVGTGSAGPFANAAIVYDSNKLRVLPRSAIGSNAVGASTSMILKSHCRDAWPTTLTI